MLNNLWIIMLETKLFAWSWNRNEESIEFLFPVMMNDEYESACFMHVLY